MTKAACTVLLCYPRILPSTNIGRKFLGTSPWESCEASCVRKAITAEPLCTRRRPRRGAAVWTRKREHVQQRGVRRHCGGEGGGKQTQGEFLRRYVQYVSEVLARHARRVSTEDDVECAELARSVTLKFFMDMEWVLSAIALGLIEHKNGNPVNDYNKSRLFIPHLLHIITYCIQNPSPILVSS